MENLIDTLKAEHQVIVKTLQEVNLLGIGHKAGQEKLLQAKEYLLAHLKKEDKFLYPVLEKKAEKSEEIKELLIRFEDEMLKISQDALDFFKKYKTGCEGFGFAKDYGKLIFSLQNRIRKEEIYLYSEYD